MDLHISVLLNDVPLENVVMLIEIGGGIFLVFVFVWFCGWFIGGVASTRIRKNAALRRFKHPHKDQAIGRF